VSATGAAAHGLFFNGGSAFELASEKQLGDIGDFVAFAGERLYDGEGGKLRELDLATSSLKERPTVDRKGNKTTAVSWSIQEVGKAASPPVTALIKAGSRLYVGSPGKLLAYQLPLDKDGEAKPAWEVEIEGTPASLVAADERLFAATLEGRVYCFGDSTGAPELPTKHQLAARALAGDRGANAKAASILKAAGAGEGYCLITGRASEALAGGLVRQSKLRIVVLEPDPKAAWWLRDELRAAGVGGDRVSVIVADAAKIELPPYFASLAIVNSWPATKDAQAALVARVFASLRPFGGVAVLPASAGDAAALAKETPANDLAGGVWKPAGGMTLLVREGPLPGSADWIGEHADASNTRVSKDSRVKAPLGLLWFGGSTSEAILPRHGHGPQPQVVGGRLFIEGMDLIRAIDIYTGRVLWEAPLPGVGDLYNNTAHQPGANASGTNYIATPEGIYVAYRRSCVVLDPATGQKTHEYVLPTPPGSKEPPLWGYLNVFENYLIGGADPLYNDGLKSARGENDNHSFSRRLVVMDRARGRVLWTADARNGFRHNAICLGGGRLFAIDRMSGPELARLKRRGQDAPQPPRLVVFDLASGQELWSTDADVFGTWLSYSAEHDVLVEAGRVASDTISDEPKGMRAYRAGGGEILWQDKSMAGPAMLKRGTILMAGRACDLLTGQPRMREHPLSGESVEWTWSRNYGCNTPMASEHLLTFRSGAAGYFDMCNDGGTGNFGGFRSSCSNNLVVAGGLLTAPDYTRTCVCSYQNQTSIALVPMPEVETWTFFGNQSPKEAVRRLGLNLGAPGDRKAEDGMLWLEYPSVGGASPAIDVATVPSQPEWFRRHSSQVSGPGLAWVAASGAKGLASLSVKLADKNASPRKYTVRLHFLEPDAVEPGQRVFSVAVQGQPAIARLDVAKEAGGGNRSLVKEIAGVLVQDRLVIELAPDKGAKEQATLLSGVEILAEGW
jgi:outer membrane protein assembly factor BamB